MGEATACGCESALAQVKAELSEEEMKPGAERWIIWPHRLPFPASICCYPPIPILPMYISKIYEIL